MWLDEHCVGHLNACTVFSCFLHPSGGGAYTQEVYHSGMAQGVDMYAAEIVLELKEKYPQITLECAIPYEGRRYGGRKPCGIVTSLLQSTAIRRRCYSGSIRRTV